MRGWGHRRKPTLRRDLAVVALFVVVALAAAYESMGWASDFGIIPFRHHPVELPKFGTGPHRVHQRAAPRRPLGPRLWADGHPHLSDLQAAAVDVWYDLRSRPSVAKLQGVAVDVEEKVLVLYGPYRRYFPYWLYRVEWYFRPQFDLCKYTHNCSCHASDHKKEGRPCQPRPPRPPHHPGDHSHSVPEPSTWLMFIAGFALLGVRLRRLRLRPGRAGEAAA